MAWPLDTYHRTIHDNKYHNKGGDAMVGNKLHTRGMMLLPGVGAVPNLLPRKVILFSSTPISLTPR